MSEPSGAVVSVAVFLQSCDRGRVATDVRELAAMLLATVHRVLLGLACSIRFGDGLRKVATELLHDSGLMTPAQVMLRAHAAPWWACRVVARTKA